MEAEVRRQLRPIGWEGGSELLKIRSISFQVQGEGDFHSVNIMSQPTCLLFPFAMPHSMWDLSSPNRERVCALGSGREEPSPLDYQGNPGARPLLTHTLPRWGPVSTWPECLPGSHVPAAGGEGSDRARACPLLSRAEPGRLPPPLSIFCFC